MLQSRASAYKVCAVIILISGNARQESKDSAPEFPLPAIKLIANNDNLCRSWIRIMTCDAHAGQIQGFFSIYTCWIKFEMDQLFLCPYLNHWRLEIWIFCSSRCGRSSQKQGPYAKHIWSRNVVCEQANRNELNEILLQMQVSGEFEGKDVILVDDR